MPSSSVPRHLRKDTVEARLDRAAWLAREETFQATEAAARAAATVQTVARAAGTEQVARAAGTEQTVGQANEAVPIQAAATVHTAAPAIEAVATAAATAVPADEAVARAAGTEQTVGQANEAVAKAAATVQRGKSWYEVSLSSSSSCSHAEEETPAAKARAAPAAKAAPAVVAKAVSQCVGAETKKEEPAGDESCMEEPAGDESCQKEPAGDDSCKEEPAGDESCQPAGDESCQKVIPAPKAEMWKWHWDKQNEMWWARGIRIGPRCGGSNTEPGLHSEFNKKKKMKRAARMERQGKEDEEDPDGAERRARVRLEAAAAQAALGEARKRWLTAHSSEMEESGRDRPVDKGAKGAVGKEKGRGASSSSAPEGKGRGASSSSWWGGGGGGAYDWNTGGERELLQLGSHLEYALIGC